MGDCHGGVTLVKLSPNLTIGGKVPAGYEGTPKEFEQEKMEKLLNVVGKFENGWLIYLYNFYEKEFPVAGAKAATEKKGTRGFRS